jgi:hypothetical protein
MQNRNKNLEVSPDCNENFSSLSAAFKMNKDGGPGPTNPMLYDPIPEGAVETTKMMQFVGATAGNESRHVDEHENILGSLGRRLRQLTTVSANVYVVATETFVDVFLARAHVKRVKVFCVVKRVLCQELIRIYCPHPQCRSPLSALAARWPGLHHSRLSSPPWD